MTADVSVLPLTEKALLSGKEPPQPEPCRLKLCVWPTS